MRNTIPVLLTVSILMLAAPSSAQEQAVPGTCQGPGFGALLDINRAFIWRGMEVNRGLLVQPDLWLSWQGLTVEAWANAVASEEDSTALTGLTELDGIIKHLASTNYLDIETSLTGYFYPRESSLNTAELGLALSRQLGPVAARAFGALDVSKYSGSIYGEIGLDWERDFSDRLAASASCRQGLASARFNQNYVGLSKDALTCLSFSLGLNYAPVKTITIVPHAEWNLITDSELGEYLDEDPFNLGLRIEFEI